MQGSLSFRGKARMFVKWLRLLTKIYGRNARVVDVIKRRGRETNVRLLDRYTL